MPQALVRLRAHVVGVSMSQGRRRESAGARQEGEERGGGTHPRLSPGPLDDLARPRRQVAALALELAHDAVVRVVDDRREHAQEAVARPAVARRPQAVVGAPAAARERVVDVAPQVGALVAQVGAVQGALRVGLGEECRVERDGAEVGEELRAGGPSEVSFGARG